LSRRFDNLEEIFHQFSMSESFYSFSINSLSGKPIDFSQFKGKVVLCVNTASKCGLTPQYKGLQELHEKYAKKGLVIIGFPCNQFGGQEPGNAEEIKNECLMNYGVEFLITEKIDVNGKNTHPVFVWLKKEFPAFLGLRSIKWNFTKFLLDSNGKPVKRFEPTTLPEDIENDIKNLLSN
jgi:glutathione peroxidase